MSTWSYCSPHSGLSTCVFDCDMLAGAVCASKVTSAALIAAYFPWVPGEWADCVVSQKVRDAASLAFFFSPTHNNKEDNSVQKSNQVFWRELCSSTLRNLLSHHCQILIRARSHPGRA